MLRRIKAVAERPRQWFVAMVVLAGVVVDASLSGWPFQSVPKGLSHYKDPTLWQLLFSDRLTVGFVRIAFVALVLYVVASVPALVVAGRWLKTFGTSGLSADEVQDAAKTVSDLRAQLKVTTQKLHATDAEVERLKKQREQAVRVADAAQSGTSRRGGRGAA